MGGLFMNFRAHKKPIIISSAIIAVLIVAVITLLAFSNRIIKSKLEEAMGPDSRVGRIDLGWNNVGVYGLKFMQDGKTAASVESIKVRADFLAILKSGISISSVTINQPSLKVEILPDGRVVAPVPLPQKKEQEPAAKPQPVTIKEIIIKNGNISFQDHRMPAPNSIEAKNINLTFKNFSYPFKNEKSTFSLTAQLAGKLLSGMAAADGSFDFATKAANVKFDGKGLAYADTGKGAGPLARAQDLSFTLASESIPGKPIMISDLVVTKPYLRVETDKRGKIKGPLGGPAGKKAEKGKKPGPQISVNKVKIMGGELLYIDGKISPPHPIRITDLNVSADYLAVPADGRPTTYQFSANIPGNISGPGGTGVLTSSGRTVLKTMDTNSRISLRNLDITVFRPYIAQKSRVDFTKGFLDLDTDMSIKNKNLRAPAHAVIKNLVLSPGKAAGLFPGVAMPDIMQKLKANNNQIAFDFVMEGNIQNPKFNLRETLAQNLASGLTKKLGGAVKGAGETAVEKGKDATQKQLEELKKRLEGFGK